MNYKLIRYSTIALFALVVIFGVGCTPAKIAPFLRTVADESARPSSGSNTPAMPVAQMPFNKPDDKRKSDDRKPDDRGKPNDKGKPDDSGKSDDKGKSDDRGKPDKGKPDNKGKP